MCMCMCICACDAMSMCMDMLKCVCMCLTVNVRVDLNVHVCYTVLPTPVLASVRGPRSARHNGSFINAPSPPRRYSPRRSPRLDGQGSPRRSPCPRRAIAVLQRGPPPLGPPPPQAASPPPSVAAARPRRRPAALLTDAAKRRDPPPPGLIPNPSDERRAERPTRALPAGEPRGCGARPSLRRKRVGRRAAGPHAC